MKYSRTMKTAVFMLHDGSQVDVYDAMADNEPVKWHATNAIEQFMHGEDIDAPDRSGEKSSKIPFRSVLKVDVNEYSREAETSEDANCNYGCDCGGEAGDPALHE